MKKLLLFLLIPIMSLAQNFWTEVAPFPGTITSIREISIVDDQIVWVSVADNGMNTFDQWARSEDGGITWTNGSFDFGNADLGISHFYALSATTAYAAVFSNGSGVDGGVWMTQDSGTSWTRLDPSIFSDVDSFPNFVHFWNTNDGIVIGDPTNGYFEIYTTHNSGTNWTRLPAGNIPAPLENEYAYTANYTVAGNTIWFATSKGRLFRSDDNGNNWIVAQSPFTDFDGDTGGHYAFKSTTEGILAAHDFRFWKTTDGGTDWGSDIQNTISGVTRNHGIVNVPATNNAYFSWGHASDNSIYGSSYTLDGGLHWISLEGVDSVMPEVAKFKSGTTGFCVGMYTNDPGLGYRFFKLTDPLNRLNGALAATSFEKNNFTTAPNPTQGVVTISGKDIQSISVCDTTGKVIITKNYFPSDTISLNMVAFQNGVYILKIADLSGHTVSQKIIKN